LGWGLQLLEDEEPKETDPDFLIRRYPDLPVCHGKYQYTVIEEDGRLRPVTLEEGKAIRRRLLKEEKRLGG
jgi:hypothetical protein